ncbi:hypothetical protein L210DRAFT_3504552 [Boletus edulis BED1]|uniref:Uncharacterized protein n=1 Tax=Boletus edulis BED1 TaxID=1328754 RepID=A0AAD4BU69_BOLED|nr:hypothetical protein L210DRAFT_3504552 [Boletus edulis BED1]
MFMAAAASILLLFVARILSVSGPVQWFILNLSRKKSHGAIWHPSPIPGVVLCSGTSSLPQFQLPPPALYESPVPLLMAKIIMSRHHSLFPLIPSQLEFGLWFWIGLRHSIHHIERVLGSADDARQAVQHPIDWFLNGWMWDEAHGHCLDSLRSRRRWRIWRI